VHRKIYILVDMRRVTDFYRRTIMVVICLVVSVGAVGQFLRQPDVYPTSKGDLEVEVIGHCFYHFRFNRMDIYVDPIPNMCQVTNLPKADLILVTHEHRDHLNTNTIELLSKPETKVIASKSCMRKMNFGQFLENGMQTTFKGIYIKAVPAYNVVNLRPDDIPYHPKGDGNGYFMVFGDVTVYIAGDTEYIDEMRFFMKPDVAFIPMMLPFTMGEDMFVQVVKKLKPKVVYPVHYNENLDGLVEKVSAAMPDLEVKIR